jgi:hypothetical protein
MARRFARDNRGRFAPKGAGATARGGRLKTASGKKRATQTMQAGGAKPSGAIKGRVKRDPGAAGKIGQGKTRASKPAPSAATIAQVGRERRATRNLNAAMKREGEGPNSKASRSASVAKRARAIYAGKVDPKAKTGARLTKTTDSEALRKRMKKMKDNNAAKPASKPKSAQDLVNASVRKVQNQKLRNLNAQIKEAGPNAAGLRLQKLQLQSNMSSTRPRTTAKQAAKSAKQDESIRGRIAEMRRQSGRVQRAEANRQRTADVRTGAAAGSKASFARRPSAKTTRSNLRAERALAFYSNPAKALREVNKKKPGFRLPRGMR